MSITRPVVAAVVLAAIGAFALLGADTANSLVGNLSDPTCTTPVETNEADAFATATCPIGQADISSPDADLISHDGSSTNTTGQGGNQQPSGPLAFTGVTVSGLLGLGLVLITSGLVLHNGSRGRVRREVR